MSKHDVTKRIIALAESYNFKLIRQSKHLIFRHECGAQLTTSKSCTDRRALKNVEANIKQILLKHNANHTNKTE